MPKKQEFRVFGNHNKTRNVHQNYNNNIPDSNQINDSVFTLTDFNLCIWPFPLFVQHQHTAPGNGQFHLTIPNKLDKYCIRFILIRTIIVLADGLFKGASRGWQHIHKKLLPPEQEQCVFVGCTSGNNILIQYCASFAESSRRTY